MSINRELSSVTNITTENHQPSQTLKTQKDSEPIRGGVLFGVPIDSFHPIPGPCPIISEKPFKPLKIHVQTAELCLIIPVLEPSLTIAWLKDEFQKRAMKQKQSRTLTSLYVGKKLLLDHFRIVEHLKTGAIVTEFVGGVKPKRKYKKGGHKKLALVSDLLNSYLNEMMSVGDNDELKQSFYEKVCDLAEIKRVGLGMEEIVSWFKRAKKKRRNVSVSKDEPSAHATNKTSINGCGGGSSSSGSASGGGGGSGHLISKNTTSVPHPSVLLLPRVESDLGSEEEQTSKKLRVELKPCIGQVDKSNTKSSGSQSDISMMKPRTTKPSVAFAPLVTEMISNSSYISGNSNVDDTLSPIELVDNHCVNYASLKVSAVSYLNQAALVDRSDDVKSGLRSSNSSGGGSSPLSFRDLLNRSLPCSPSVLSISSLINTPMQSEGEEDKDEEDDDDDVNEESIVQTEQSRLEDSNMLLELLPESPHSRSDSFGEKSRKSLMV